MTRTLQKKFVVTAMAAISILLLLLLGAINVANFIMVGNQIDRNLQMIAARETGGEAAPPREDIPPRRFLEPPKNAYDTVLSSNYFVVRYDPNGNITEIDVSRTSTVSEDDARERAALAYVRGWESGRDGRFRYLLQTSPEGSTVIFLDTSGERFSYLRVLLLSVGVGAVCWGLMLALVMFLSRRAIRPMEENIQRQKQFVTNAGHEIKTPLAIIQSNAEALELYQGESKWSRNIKEQTQRLDGLMKNLLTLARMDEGARVTRPEEVPLSQMVEERAADFLQPMEDRSITLKQEIQPDLTIRADRAQMEQLLSTLLDNSVKYTDEGGAVWVRLNREGRHLRLSVENTCPALPDVPPEKLFDRFYRGNSARTQKSGGYGIGLAVARSLAQANGGSLRARYLPPNRICFEATFEWRKKTP